MSALGGRLRRSLGAKLLAAQVLVIVAGSLTLAVVALAVAPGLFHYHARMALGTIPADTARHLDEGLAVAMLVALGAGTVVALLTAVGVSAFLARRIVRPIGTLARAAERIAHGRYTARVPQGSSGDELAMLSGAFNTMAEALETSEQQRQRLLADLAHELRTPLATIDGYLEGVADHVMAADEQTWQVLRAETARLGRLVDDLNAVSRAEERHWTCGWPHGSPPSWSPLLSRPPRWPTRPRAWPWSSGPTPTCRAWRPTPTASARCSPTCSPTRCGTPKMGGGSRSPPPATAATSSLRSATPARASLLSCWSGCSSASGASTAPAPMPATPTGAGSG